MHTCPACQRAAIPAWRGFLIPAFANNAYRCPACQAMLKRRRSAIDMACHVPVAATTWLAFTQGDMQSAFFVMWSLFLAAVAGISLWALTIRYETVDETHDHFKPHTTSLTMK